MYLADLNLCCAHGGTHREHSKSEKELKRETPVSWLQSISLSASLKSGSLTCGDNKKGSWFCFPLPESEMKLTNLIGNK